MLKEWTEEERKEAAREAARETMASILLEQLEEKFDLVPGRIKDKLHEIQDSDMLRYLTKKIIKVTTVEEFEDYLEKAKQQQSK